MNLKLKTLLVTALVAMGCLAALLAISLLHSIQSVQNGPGSQYVILAANDLGMHCYQQDFSDFLILPPGNNLKVQVFKKEGTTAELVNTGVVVTYEIIDNTTSANKTNFWEYARNYGYYIAPDMGITGNGLRGTFQLSADEKYYEALAIPVTPYNDNNPVPNPYQMAIIKVFDAKTNALLVQTDEVVVPVSDEMSCNVCHGPTDTNRNILKAHDDLSGTRLIADLQYGKRYKCADCHSDPILYEPGRPGVLPLSQAIHGFHADKMSKSDITPVCYNCHPGTITQCDRGVMYIADLTCDDSNCHGTMANVADTIAQGRTPWFNEPDCGACHGPAYAANDGLLYRDSYLLNGPSAKMNNILLCESCHNSSHAEWPSSLHKDNLLPISLLGYPSYINRCNVCHEGAGTFHRGTH